jgi:hypothetical protein
MKIRAPRPANTLVAIQRCGYAQFRDPRSGDFSYTRRLGTGFYPRFHLYVEEREDVLVLNLHLDQKQPSYGVGHMHSGEYDGPTVETEAARIVSQLKK